MLASCLSFHVPVSPADKCTPRTRCYVIRAFAQEVGDPTAVRALRFVRHDPLTSPDEPLRVRWRWFHATAASTSEESDRSIIVARELCTVADAHAAVATQAGVEVQSSRLVLSGCALDKPDELLYDAGYKSSRSVLYLQVKLLKAEDGGSEWLFEHS